MTTIAPTTAPCEDEAVHELNENTDPGSGDMLYVETEGHDDEYITLETLQQFIASAQKNKNLIINGCMRISQRNAAIATAVANGGYSLDRWLHGENDGGQYTSQQSTDGPTGTAFTKCLRVGVATADVVLGAGAYYMVQQKIEGQNLQHLLYGNAAAKTLTLSFWVKSYQTGQFGGWLETNDGTARAFPFGYTIDDAETWEYKTIEIPGDASAQIDNDNGNGLKLAFGLGMGSTYSGGTKDAWANIAVGLVDSSWNTNVMSSTDNYWCVTGVQIEVGDVATDFEYLSIDELIAKCQRYYSKSYEIDVAPGDNTLNRSPQVTLSKNVPNTGWFAHTTWFPVRLRELPSVTVYAEDGTVNSVTVAGTTRAVSNKGHTSQLTFGHFQNGSGVQWNDGEVLEYHWTADAEL